MRAVCTLRSPPTYRRDVFCAGLEAAGYKLHDRVATPKPDDVLVTWNRYGEWHREALRWEQHGARVIVAENGYLGKQWADDSWYALSLWHHAGKGVWPYSDVRGTEQRSAGPEVDTAFADRWDSIGVNLLPWRPDGGEVIILHQRGIGEPGIKSPHQWHELMRARIKKARVRVHPGAGNTIELEHDVRDASAVVTWASGAALRCMAWGIPVWYDMHGWIGESAARHVRLYGDLPPVRDDDARLLMFRRLAWAQWRLEEIGSGKAFAALQQP